MTSAIPADLGRSSLEPAQGGETPRHDLFAALMELLIALPAPPVDARGAAERAPAPAAATPSEATPTEDAEAGALEIALTLALGTDANTPPARPDAPPPQLVSSAVASVSSAELPAVVSTRVLPPLAPRADLSDARVQESAPAQPARPEDSRGLPTPAVHGKAGDVPVSEAPVRETTERGLPVPPAPAQSERSPQTPVAPASAAASLSQRAAITSQLRAIAPSGRSSAATPGLEPVPLDATSAAPLRIESAIPAQVSFAPDAAPASPTRAPERPQPVVTNAVLLAEQGGGSARLELSPPELGPVEIVVRVRGKRVDVHVRADESAAQQIVRDSRERLAEALSARDLRMESFSVDGGGAGSAGGDSRGAGRESAAPQLPRGSAGEQSARGPRERSVPHAVIPTAGAIDLRV